MSHASSLPIVDPSATAAACGSGTAVMAAPQPIDPATCRGTFSMVSLGCPKNLVDSERMLGLLREDGWQLVSDPQGSDLVVVNTCAFIDASRAESYAAINEMLELKQAGATRGVIVAGCLAERQKEALLDELPGVDAVIGVFSRDEIARTADGAADAVFISIGTREPAKDAYLAWADAGGPLPSRRGRAAIYDAQRQVREITVDLDAGAITEDRHFPGAQPPLPESGTGLNPHGGPNTP